MPSAPFYPQLSPATPSKESPISAGFDFLPFVGKRFAQELCEEIGRPECQRCSITFTYHSTSRATSKRTCVGLYQPFTVRFVIGGLGHDSPLAIELKFRDSDMHPIIEPADMLLQGNNSWQAYGASQSRNEYLDDQLNAKSFRWENFAFEYRPAKPSFRSVVKGLRQDVEEVAFATVGTDTTFHSSTRLRDHPSTNAREGTRAAGTAMEAFIPLI